MGVLINLNAYRGRYLKAKYYWKMTRCSYVELARYAGVATDRARRWEQKWVKEKNGK